MARIGKFVKIERKKLKAIVVSFAVLMLFWTYAFDIEVKVDKRLAKTLGIKEVNSDSITTKAVQNPEAERLANAVIPEEGYKVNIQWGDVGQKLVASGAIDLNKYKDNYTDPYYKELLSYLTDNKSGGITINRENAYFWVNTLWALGLTQKSDVLSKGVMTTEHKDNIGNFASTGGWTLGSKDAVNLFSSTEIVSLTSEQNQKVFEIAENIFRPCCGNSTAFPDCNHGMAILGLIELMVSQGFSEEEIYEAALAFNSYWFNQTYIDLAYYFEKTEGLPWSEVDSKKVLSAEFSSSGGYQAIKKTIGDAPVLQTSGGGCGA